MNDLERSSVELTVVAIGGGADEACTVTTSCVEGLRSIEVVLAGQNQFAVTSSVDFEDAIQRLRSQLEAVGLLLQCTRFRRDAFVSGMSRSMTDGLSCYVVSPGEGVDPTQLKSCLDAAPVGTTVTEEEARAHIGAWIAKGPTKTWLLRSWLKLGIERRRDRRAFERSRADNELHSGQ